MNAIEIENLSKSFRSSRSWIGAAAREKKEALALQKLNLNIKSGEIFALLGPNGAGKTTLLKILSQLVIADSGQIRVLGHDLSKNGLKIKAQVSLLLGEERGFYCRLTGRQNLEFFAALYEVPPREIASKILQAQDFFEISDLDQPYQEYSSGTKQRLALARCFISRTKLILMDEPTRSLDPSKTAKFRTLLKNFLAEEPGRTILFTTHNTQEAELLAHRIGILDHGKLVASGTLGELRSAAPEKLTSLETIFNTYTQNAL